MAWNNKGQITNYIAPIMFIFSFSLIVILCYLIYFTFDATLATTSVYTADVATTSQYFLTTLRFMDYVVGIMSFLFIVGIGVTTFKLASAPIFFLLTFFMTAILGFFAYIISYVFTQFATNSAFNAIIVYFPITLLITTNLHWLMLLIITVGSITLFGKEVKGQYT